MRLEFDKSNPTHAGCGIVALLLCFLLFVASCTNTKSNFVNPPMSFRPCPLWFWNDTEITAQVAFEQMKRAKEDCRYGGFGIVPFGKKFTPAYLGDDYFVLYEKILHKARQLGMTVSLYDEYGFPSGSAGSPNSAAQGLFQQKYPQFTLKRLDKYEETVEGPKSFEKY
jgi:hypothetical protein